jgi:hypothetical protein
MDESNDELKTELTKRRRVPLPLRLVTPWFAAVLLLVGISAYQQRQYRQEVCERGNHARRVEIPQAFDEFTDELGEQLNAPQTRIDETKTHMRHRFDRIFPEIDC